jgi:hypothetical protein
MYLPKSKYIVKATKGGEFLRKDGTYYTGVYIETYKGNFYEGKEFKSGLPTLKDTRNTGEFSNQPVRFKNNHIKPTKKDYENGKFTRYFVQDKRNKSIIEVNRKNFLKFKLEVYVKTVSLEWILSSPLENINKGPYIYFGARAQNKEAVEEAEKDIKGISQFIINFDQFVV